MMSLFEKQFAGRLLLVLIGLVLFIVGACWSSQGFGPEEIWSTTDEHGCHQGVSIQWIGPPFGSHSRPGYWVIVFHGGCYDADRVVAKCYRRDTAKLAALLYGYSYADSNGCVNRAYRGYDWRIDGYPGDPPNSFRLGMWRVTLSPDTLGRRHVFCSRMDDARLIGEEWGRVRSGDVRL